MAIRYLTWNCPHQLSCPISRSFHLSSAWWRSWSWHPSLWHNSYLVFLPATMNFIWCAHPKFYGGHIINGKSDLHSLCNLEVLYYTLVIYLVTPIQFLHMCGEEHHRCLDVLTYPGTHEKQLSHCVMKTLGLLIQ